MEGLRAGRGRLAAGKRLSAGRERKKLREGRGETEKERPTTPVKAAKCEISPEHRVPLRPGPARPPGTGGEGSDGQSGTELISIINYQGGGSFIFESLTI